MNVRFETPDIEGLTKKFMLVDMHFHSKYSHDCSTSIESIIKRAKELGVYVALTDHNSIDGVLCANRIEPGRIKPGVEVTTREGKDVLLYFPTVRELKEFFNKHVKPHVRNKSSIRGGKTGIRAAALFKALEGTNAVIVMPHPFAVGPRRSYMFFRKRKKILSQFHAIEVVNQALPHKSNLLAVGWATETGKTVIGGSDGHIAEMLGSSFTCCKAQDWREFLDQIKRGRTIVVGEKRKLHQHVANMGRILKEKGKVIQNRRIRNGK